ncbi:MAG: type 4a pilus biogenesis protein PilO [Thermoleophilaceae bacterium]|jgi:Tfp pilus assembly protein PilO
MSVTDRDKKIILMIVPILLIGAFYYFVLSPKRQEASKVQQELTQAQGDRDSAQAQVSQLTAAKNSFASDYQTVISLGKAVPATVDMPSLLVQLNTAAHGTGISFDDIHLGDTSASGTSSPAATPPGGGSNPAAPGSAPASGGPGGAAQNAGQAVSSANAKNNANAATEASTGGTGNTSSGAGTVQGLNSIPLDFSFTGDFTNLADFFHRMKRFVQVVNGQIQVRGRLMTIDSFTFASGGTFPALNATVKATVYLAPKAEGIAAGATAQGPAGTSTASAPSTSTAPSNSTPTAVVTR